MTFSKYSALLLYFLSSTMAGQVSVKIDASQEIGPYNPTYRFFGCDEPNYAYYPDGQKTIAEIGELGPAQAFFRTHNLLTTGDGIPALKWGSTNVYTEDSQGNPIYNWTVVDKIFDTYLQRGVKPYAQIGFMPEALAIDPEPYFFNFTPTSNYNVIYTGWSHPPKSYEKWGNLVYEWVKHCVERYGKEEVESWFWAVWNEPNIPYWNGTVEQYYELYDYAIDGVLRALPSATVGGPDVAGGSGDGFLPNFIDHCLNGTNYATKKTGTSLDFTSFHAKGAPNFINTTSGGYVQMGIAAQLQNIDDAFSVIAAYPQVKDKPIVIGEDDPDGCAACITPQYGYRNGLLYPSFIAAGFTRAMDLSIKYGVNLIGTLTWAFEYDDHPYFDGFRVLTTNGIDKPVFNVHKMFGKMTGQRIQATSSGQQPLESVVANGVRNATDVGVISSLDKDKLFVFIWHYHDDDLPKPDAEVHVQVDHLPWSGSAQMSHYRIDNDHSNAYTKWLSLGSPQNVTSEQFVELENAGMLGMLGYPTPINITNGSVQVDFALPIHAISLLVVEKQA